MNTRKNLRHFISDLSSEERDFLLLELMAKKDHFSKGSRITYPAELLRMERWILNSIGTVSSPRIRNSRTRFWFIFMLLRYGGLRMEEIFNLQADSLDLANCQIIIRQGGHPRIVPLSPHVSTLMSERLAESPAFFVLDRPFLCDGSLVRRSFSQYSTQCGISPHLVSARALRRHRALELEYAGLPLSLVNLFLGRLIAEASFDAAKGQKILRQTIDNEQFPKTSARNSFYGPLVSLVKRGILVETALESAQGLTVKATITDTSCQNLKLALGMAVRALVKAPWVRLFVPDKKEQKPAGNCFYGTIKEIKQDSDAMEIIVALSQGHIICALYADCEKPAFPLAVGDNAGVAFSPLAVILTTA